MRYTTIIDVRYLPWYRNPSARLVYIHLVMIAGWHDDDRDIARISYRRLAIEVGLTLSATRHALQQLTTTGMITATDKGWMVKKWEIPKDITPLQKIIKGKKSQQAAAAVSTRSRDTMEKLEQERQNREALAISGKSQFMVYYENQLVKANEGDAEALAAVERYKTIYEEHKKKFTNKK